MPIDGQNPRPEMKAQMDARDQAERERMHSLLTEAAETATFHRVELERWERIGRAAGAALVQFDSVNPVEQVTADMLVYATQESDTSDPMPRPPKFSDRAAG